MKRITTREAMSIGEKIKIIQKVVPTFTSEKLLECSVQDFEDLLTKIINYNQAKFELDKLIALKNY